VSSHTLINGDSFIELDNFPENYFTGCVTDPPYGLSFMGKNWDTFTDNQALQEWTKQWATELFRVLKPGAFALVFGGTRTFHRITSGLEDAGFEIKDCISWLQGQGFPKSYDISKGIESKLSSGSANTKDFKKLKGERFKGNIGFVKTNFEQGNRPANYNDRANPFILDAQTEEAKNWEGFGTALSPSWEPIIVAMKPREGTYVNNALVYGVAGLNINNSRIGIEERNVEIGTGEIKSENNSMAGANYSRKIVGKVKGRWPKNVILDEEAGKLLDLQTGGIEKAGFVRNVTKGARVFNNDGEATEYITEEEIQENPAGKSRFFFCAKAGKKEKNLGLEGLPDGVGGGMSGTVDGSLLTGSGNIRNNKMKNTHATVKPISLMRYLIRLITMPKNTLIIDPFAGSNTTGVAAILEGVDYVGIEKEEEYYNIGLHRAAYFKANRDNLLADYL